jgi:uncharacterized SAM-binding protein YcdF (DUF218 family)
VRSLRVHSRRARVVATILAVLLLVFIAASARLFVWPARDQPSRADAILVLGGDGPRVDRGVTLAKQRYAPVLLVSQRDREYVPSGCVPRIRGVEVVCFQPNPISTQGEARYIARLATKRHWRRIIAVTSTPQDTRARLRLKRCYRGQLLVVTVHPSFFGWARDILYEWGGLMKALVWQTSC